MCDGRRVKSRTERPGSPTKIACNGPTEYGARKHRLQAGSYISVAACPAASRRANGVDCLPVPPRSAITAGLVMRDLRM